MKHKFLLTIGFALAACGNANAWCWNEQNLTTPTPEGGADLKIGTTVRMGRLDTISVGEKQYRVLRNQNGVIEAIADSDGNKTPIGAISATAPLAGNSPPRTNVPDPCQTGGDSMILDIAELPPVEITRERADDVYLWKDITESAYPSVPEVLFTPPDPDRVSACRKGAETCIATAGDHLPLFLPVCLKATDQVKVKKPGWGGVVFAAIMGACTAAAEYWKQKNVDKCWGEYASCVANG